MKELLEHIVQSGLLPNPITFVAQLISTVILFYLLKRLVWKPMQNFLDERKEVIVGELESAKASNEEAQRNKDETVKQLNEAKQQALNIVDAAKSQAVESKEIIIKEAEKEALYKLEKAEKEIEQDRRKAEKEIKARAIELAFVAAEKLINENVDNQKNQKMIEQFIDEVGE